MQRQLWITADNDSRRSRRFPIEAPLRYRVSGEADWRKGKTENISSAGVLFRSEHAVDRTARVEMNFVLLTPGSEQMGLEVACKGEVVRLELPLDEDRLPALAVKISDYRLRPWAQGRWNLDESFTASGAEE